MDKLKDINCFGKFHIDKVGGIRADLVKMEKKLAKSKLPKEAVSNWNERIPVTVTADGNKKTSKNWMSQALQEQWKAGACIHYRDAAHKRA